MKKIVLLVFALLLFGQAQAQSPFAFGWEQDGGKAVAASCSNMYDLRPFDNNVGITVYGSDYRKVLDTKRWGQRLVLCGALAVVVGCPLIEKNLSNATDLEIANAVLGAVAVGAGIPLWIIGQKKLDKYIDDYSSRYAPGPRAQLSAGATGSGFGVALNF